MTPSPEDAGPPRHRHAVAVIGTNHRPADRKTAQRERQGTMNKTRIGALLSALLITGALFAVPFAGAAFAVTEHCPDGWVTKDESGEDDNDIVLEAGTQFCVKGSTTASGILIADGETTLKEYLEAAGENA